MVLPDQKKKKAKEFKNKGRTLKGIPGQENKEYETSLSQQCEKDKFAILRSHSPFLFLCDDTHCIFFTQRSCRILFTNHPDIKNIKLCGIQPGRRVHLRARVKTWQESSSQYGDFLFLFPQILTMYVLKLPGKSLQQRNHSSHPNASVSFVQFHPWLSSTNCKPCDEFILSHFNYLLVYQVISVIKSHFSLRKIFRFFGLPAQNSVLTYFFLHPVLSASPHPSCL